MPQVPQWHDATGRNSYLGTSGQKYDPAIRSGDLDFLWQMHFHYRVTFTGYIRCFCATTSHDHFGLDLLFFDLESVSCACTVLLMSDPHTDYYYPMTIGYWVTSTEFWSHFRYLKQSLRMRRVTWPLTVGKNSPHFWNPWPHFAYSLCHCHGATTNIKPCYTQKIAFSHYEDYKVYCACAVSRDLSIGGPPKPHVTIFWPRIAYLQLLWGYDDD